MESEFRSTGIRLRWGDTKPKECKDNGFNCKFDLRITTNAAKHINPSAADYAKKPDISKYYIDEPKLVLSGYIRLRKYTSSNDVVFLSATFV
ncbi:hypothetical protein HMPREF1544_00502 [Mucor circinelloides 1006PhL]|uniref:Uncharacterized protein n=1 Tax=Mucor circinelloides f. circinelloides (strain 1006PhL) TaxID=1220926 RepID=S2JR79_MUCC1|nr:hypothetical protein HMPREF1544_00502 [Mucor circinelloides 1006PhL]KAG1088856.1 hypothetical protein G6F42_020148 [Rhizopus arrhizus]